jgi:hypothetical protein
MQVENGRQISPIGRRECEFSRLQNEHSWPERRKHLRGLINGWKLNYPSDMGAKIPANHNMPSLAREFIHFLFYLAGYFRLHAESLKSMG